MGRVREPTECSTQGLQQQEDGTTLSLKGRAVKSWICGRAAQTRVVLNHRQAGPGTRGRGHSLSFTSYFAATPIGQTHLKAKEPVTQSMGPQSLDQGKEN